MYQLLDMRLPPLHGQGRAGVGLFELAAWFEFAASLLHPTPTLPPDQVRGRLYYT
jgi:hypothetical protein